MEMFLVKQESKKEFDSLHRIETSMEKKLIRQLGWRVGDKIGFEHESRISKDCRVRTVRVYNVVEFDDVCYELIEDESAFIKEFINP